MPFVAREQVLADLLGRLDAVRSGAGSLLFLTGDAGTGKTTLLQALITRAQDNRADLVAALGTCDMHTGVGDPYLPFREILQQLTGDTDESLSAKRITPEGAARLKKLVAVSGEALVEIGPDLIGAFVPGAGLAARALTFLAEKRGWMDKLQALSRINEARIRSEELAVDQAHIFEQYLNVLKKLSEKQPLLLVLDDLQWADQGSIDLLFYLARRIGESPVLIVGAYRPSDVALGRLAPNSQETVRHPLEKTVAECRRYFGEIMIDLNAVSEAGGREFVDAFLDTEPNRLDAHFRKALFQHTQGHPLFTVELVRALQERGELVRDGSGHWTVSGNIGWNELPDRVEGVIEERIGRLETDLKEILSVGSVEGEEFTAEVVAALQDSDVRQIIHSLSGALEKQHRLVVSEGVTTVAGPVRRISRFRFSHNLFRTFLYNGLSAAERAYLHEDVGLLLETFYGKDDPAIALQLAFHFFTSENTEKAAHYLALAGNQAMLTYANNEALRLFSRAIEVSVDLDLELRYELYLRREKIFHWEGMRSEQHNDLEALQKLADQSADPVKLAEVAYRWSLYHASVSDYEASERCARQVAGYAATPAVAIEAQIQLAHITYWHHGEKEKAASYLNEAFSRAQENGLTRVAGVALNELSILYALSGDYPVAADYCKRGLEVATRANAPRLATTMRTNLGRIYNEMGRADLAEPVLQEGLAESRRMGARRSEANDLNYLAHTAEIKGDLAQSLEFSFQSLEICTEIGARGNAGFINGNIGNLKMAFGMYASARLHFEKAYEIGVEIHSKRVQVLNLGNLSKLMCSMDNPQQCLHYVEDGLVLSEEMGDPSVQAYLLLWQGVALAALGRFDESEVDLLKVLNIRRELEQPGRIADALAAMLYLAEQSAAPDDIRKYREALIAQLELAPDLPLSEDPASVYLICIESLKQAGDSRTDLLLEAAFELVRSRALKIKDRKWRRAYLEDVPANRRIIECHQQRSRDPVSQVD